MSSLQKFHRRTQSLGPIGPFTTIGSGSTTIGYWLGTHWDGVSKLIVAPSSTEVSLVWSGNAEISIARGTTSTTNGLANTNTLYAFGSAAHPSAYYCRTLATGGYNTWYLPAKDELNVLYSNKSATPFATANSFAGSYYQSSTEYTSNYYWAQNFSSGAQKDSGYIGSKNNAVRLRAVRKL